MPHSITNSKKPGITVRDGVHLDMEFTPLEARIIDTPQLQRLRNLKQLGFAYLVYPSATHTRFEHSLGVCHLTGLLIDKIAKNTHYKFASEDRDIARAFALVHDASHIPFGHTLEDEHNVFQRHDKGTRLLSIIDQPELKTALDDLYEPVRSIIEFVSHGKHLYHDKSSHSHIKPYLVDLVAGTIGADLLDYLQRDNLFTGLRREYDSRVFDYFAIRNDQLVVDLTKHEMVRIDAVSDVMDLLRMRYTLTEKVYYHHTKLAFGAVLAKAVRIAQEMGCVDEKIIAEMGDWDLLHYLSEDLNMPEVVRKITKRITPRDLYHRAFAFPRSEFGGADVEYISFVEKYRAKPKMIAELEFEIARVAGLPLEDIVVYCPSSHMQLKEAQVPAYANKQIVPLIDLKDNMPPEAKFYYDKFSQLWTFYVFVYGDLKTAASVGEISAQILDKPNYYKLTRV